MLGQKSNRKTFGSYPERTMDELYSRFHYQRVLLILYYCPRACKLAYDLSVSEHFSLYRALPLVSNRLNIHQRSTFYHAARTHTVCPIDRPSLTTWCEVIRTDYHHRHYHHHHHHHHHHQLDRRFWTLLHYSRHIQYVKCMQRLYAPPRPIQPSTSR